VLKVLSKVNPNHSYFVFKIKIQLPKVIIVFFINLIGFDFVWFGLIYWGNAFTPIAFLLLGLHFYFAAKAKLKELYLICAVASIGILVDSTLQYLRIFIFPELNILPLWLVTLWFCFAATLCHSLKFLQHSKLLQWFTGAFLAPMSYLAGYKLDVVSFSLTVTSTFVVLSFVWSVLMIVFFTLKSYLIQEDHNYA